jgi:phage-related protein
VAGGRRQRRPSERVERKRRTTDSRYFSSYPKTEIIGVKRIVWLGDSLDRLREFPVEARHEAGYQLERIQAGRDPADWKPMPLVGLGVSELRIRAGGAHRVIYMAKFVEAVYVLHAFRKKSQKTPRTDIDLASRRFAALIKERKQP